MILLTGFDAFAGATVNPSWLVAQQLHGRRFAGCTVVAAQLPTEFGASRARLERLLETQRPALVICLGLAADRRALSLERVAVNLDDAEIADNAGCQPRGTPVIAGAPMSYATGLPVAGMLTAIEAAGVAVRMSDSAGRFVCNHVFYGLMHHLAMSPPQARVRGGFIHVPPLPEQSPEGMPLAHMVLGLRAGIRAALAEPCGAGVQPANLGNDGQTAS